MNNAQENVDSHKTPTKDENSSNVPFSRWKIAFKDLSATTSIASKKSQSASSHSIHDEFRRKQPRTMIVTRSGK